MVDTLATCYTIGVAVELKETAAVGLRNRRAEMKEVSLSCILWFVYRIIANRVAKACRAEGYAQQGKGPHTDILSKQ